MESVLIGKTHLEECPKCEGVWADGDAVRQICADQEQQAAVLGTPVSQTAESAEFEERVHYIPCPVCKDLMNRVNFPQCSNVIVNVCGRHGTWFDKDELRRIVEFIRSGGLEKSRSRQMEELEERQQQARTAAQADALEIMAQPPPWSESNRHLGVSIAASVVRAILDI